MELEGHAWSDEGVNNGSSQGGEETHKGRNKKRVGRARHELEDNTAIEERRYFACQKVARKYWTGKSEGPTSI
jgi:hypothetical protein